jgi:catechol 2,3-dioxygenase-like lactoylglutathione lyase family enzyme
MKCRLEHANITVRSVDEGVRFLTTAFPDFKIRGDGRSDQGDYKKHWLHVGTEQTYIALEEVTPGTESPRRPYRDPGINHIGLVVDDLEALTGRLQAAGYDTGDLAEDIDSRRRTYIFDGNGVEWEFVQYLTHDPEKANTYDS